VILLFYLNIIVKQKIIAKCIHRVRGSFSGISWDNKENENEFWISMESTGNSNQINLHKLLQLHKNHYQR